MRKSWWSAYTTLSPVSNVNNNSYCLSVEVVPQYLQPSDLGEMESRPRSCLWLVCAYSQWCVSLHPCKGARRGLDSQVGGGGPPAFPRSCRAGFSGVESLSDLIDGDPPESMRPGKQDGPSFWRARRPSVWEAGWGLCVWHSCVNLGLQSNGVCLPWCHAA